MLAEIYLALYLLKVETHKDGQRIRYFGDDDKYDLQQVGDCRQFGGVCVMWKIDTFAYFTASAIPIELSIFQCIHPSISIYILYRYLFIYISINHRCMSARS